MENNEYISQVIHLSPEGLIKNKNPTEILKNIPILDLLNRIQKFKGLKFNKLTDNEIKNELAKVFEYEGTNWFYSRVVILNENSTFYRIKKLDEKDALSNVIPVPNKIFYKEKDYWETPQEFVKSGRLNKEHEPLLYVSQDIDCCLNECHIKENDFFTLIKYKAKKNIKLRIICSDLDFSKLCINDEHAQIIYTIMNLFLIDEFTRFVGIGTEYLYKISQNILKYYFKFPSDMQDGYCYPSIQDRSKQNICFEPYRAHELLKVDNTVVCKMSSQKYDVLFDATETDVVGNIIFKTI